MKKVRSTLLTFVTLGSLVLALGAQAQEKQKIRMGTEGAYAPFNYLDKDGKLAGFDIEIGNALCEEMKADCEWVTSDWEGIIPALLAKKFDLIIASMSITDDRKKIVDFTERYYRIPAVLVSRKELVGETPFSFETLKGKKIGVQAATIHENFAQSKFEGAKVVSYPSFEQMVLDIKHGRLDYIHADLSVVQESFLKTEDGKDFTLVGPQFNDEAFFGEGIGIAVRKKDEDLRKNLNEAIEAIRKNGVYAKISETYFEFDPYGEDKEAEAK